MVSLRTTAEPPAFTPGSRYGLLSVAEPADDGGAHWRNGVQFTPRLCGTALTTGSVCVTAGAVKPATADGIPTRGADPFAVYAWVDCSPVGYTPEAWRRITTEALLSNESYAVERVFATGVVAGGTVYPHLAADTDVYEGDLQTVQLQTAATIAVTGGGVDIVEAVGILEARMGACYGGIPVLHAPLEAVAHLANKNLLVRDGPRLRTFAGSYIAAGRGYPGTAPDGSTPPAGVRWLYATGAVKVWRSGIELTGTNPAEWIGRARNDQVLIAERTYVIGWDCCHFAVPAVLGGDITGTPGVAT